MVLFDQEFRSKPPKHKKVEPPCSFPLLLYLIGIHIMTSPFVSQQPNLSLKTHLTIDPILILNPLSKKKSQDQNHQGPEGQRVLRAKIAL